MTHAPELTGQTVVVIGGSSGMGLETARRAREEGAEVILTGRNAEHLREREAAKYCRQRPTPVFGDDQSGADRSGDRRDEAGAHRHHSPGEQQNVERRRRASQQRAAQEDQESGKYEQGAIHRARQRDEKRGAYRVKEAVGRHDPAGFRFRNIESAGDRG